MLPDITARIRMYSPGENGRKEPLPAKAFGCPFFHKGEGFDCRLLLDQTGTVLVPGGSYTVKIKFLYPDLIKPRLRSGEQFKLWDTKDFADGEVLEVH